MKKLFKRGLLALLPMVLTIFLVYLVVTTLYNYIAVPFGESIRWLVLHYTDREPEYFAKGSGSDGLVGWLYRFAPWVGLVVGLILTFTIGLLVATLLGKKLGKAVESLFVRLPVVSAIYPYAKQFADFLSPGEQKVQFKNAVAIPYPSPGIYSIGFLTSEGLRHLNDHFQKHLVCVFVPTAPTPFSGFVCFVPREDVVPLPVTVDEALALIVSCGVITPPHQAIQLGIFATAAAAAGKPLAAPEPAKPAS